MQKNSIDNCQISDESSHDPKLYPLKSVYHAFEILRLYQVGRIKSVQATSDKVQISTCRAVTTWIHPGSGRTIELDIGNKTDVNYINCTLALEELLGDLDDGNLKRQTFVARYIGIPDPDSDTGDAISLGCNRIADLVGKPSRTIRHWCQELREEYTQILVRRGLLDPIYLN